jgi:hypothetical protein
MKRYAMSGAALGLLLSLAAAGLLSGCGTAQAEPIEVTYYYLPG